MFYSHYDDEGLQGLGLGGGAQAARAVIEGTLKPLLIGQDPLHIEKIWDDLFWAVRGVGRKGLAFCAISAVDVALWDLKAKFFEVPLYQLLGPYTEKVPIYGSGGWTHFNLDELLAEQTGYVDRGMKSVKMKVGKDFGQSEQEDIERLAATREAVGDDIEILIDANNGYYAKQAIRMAKAFEPYRVGWFEEPVLADDIEGLAAVARAIDIPVATGEHEYTKLALRSDRSRRGRHRSAGRRRVGGITEWMKVAHLAHAFNLPVAPHAYQLVHLHLACATPNLRIVEYLGAVEEADKIFYTEFPQPDPDGMWAPYPDKPGLGLELDPTAVKKYSV